MNTGGDTVTTPDALVVELWPRESECIICDAKIFGCSQGLAMFEGEVVKEDSTVEWGGFDCCVECYSIWQEGGAAAINAYANHLTRIRDR